MAELIVNSGQSTLSAGINNSVTTIPITDVSAFPNSGNFRILIDNELMLVTGVSGSNFTVTRAIESTGAASHASLAAVTAVLTAAGIAAFVSESGGGASVYQGTMTDAPASPPAGDLAFPLNQAGAMFVSNGSIFQGYGPSYGPFSIGAFATLVGDSTLTRITNGGVLVLKDTSTVGSGENIRMYCETPPSTPWTMTLVFSIFLGTNLAGGGARNAGIGIRDSSTGHIQGMAIGSNNLTINIYQFTDVHTFSGTPYSPGWAGDRNIFMFRIVNDGTNLTFYISYDFLNWNFIGTQALSGAFVATIDQVGFYSDNPNTPNTVMTVYHASLVSGALVAIPGQET